MAAARSGGAVLDVTLKFLADEMNAYLERRLGAAATGKAVASALVDDSGKWLLPENQLGLTLVSIDEERTMRAQLPERVAIASRDIELHPPLQLNLVLLLAARFARYDQALGFLSHGLIFFQAQPVFTPSTHPALDARIERLVVEMLAYGPEQLNQTWACLGAKYLPSALYRVRMIALQDREPQSVGRAIEELRTTLGGKALVS
jgi:hypothetical protein